MTAGVAGPVGLTAPGRAEGVDVAAAAARRVVAALLHVGDQTDADMSAVADRLNAIADHLGDHAPEREERMVNMWAGEGMSRHDPVTGTENVVAPPLRLSGNPDGSVSGVVTLDLPYQGPPGCVHGGVSALLLDHTLGVANHWAGTSGMTAELTLRYLRPTPLFTPLTVAARRTSVDGRKIRTIGSISADGVEYVIADALFIEKHPPLPGR